MVNASTAGADIFVDGSSKGKAPFLLQKLAAEKVLVVEARSADLSARVEPSLKPGELREISLELKKSLGNLFIDSPEKTLAVLIDGLDKGTLGNGIFRDLAAGNHVSSSGERTSTSPRPSA